MHTIFTSRRLSTLTIAVSAAAALGITSTVASANPSVAPAVKAKSAVIGVGVNVGSHSGAYRYRPGFYPSYYPRHYGPRFYSRAYFSGPSIGLYVPLLPWGYTTLWVGSEPYYRYNNVYYVADVDGGYRVAAPPAQVITSVEVAPSASDVPSGEMVMLFPRQGQTETQATFDRIECEKAASQVTGHNPAQSAPDAAKLANYRNALRSCLDNRGYSLK
jgi:hypothetical protein